MRRQNTLDIQLIIDDWNEALDLDGIGKQGIVPCIEAAVLDTAPELDHDWINQ